MGMTATRRRLPTTRATTRGGTAATAATAGSVPVPTVSILTTATMATKGATTDIAATAATVAITTVTVVITATTVAGTGGIIRTGE